MKPNIWLSKIVGKITAAGVVAGLLFGWSPQTMAGGTALSYSGEAVVFKTTFSGLLALPPVVISDTGPLPSSGGALQTSLLTENVPGLASVEVCHAATIGQDDYSHSDASVGKTSLTPGLGNTIQADALSSYAVALCCTGPSAYGSADVASLVVNGTPVTVSGQPNQTIPLIGGEIIINEQIISQDSDSAAITVNALHVIVNGVADIVVSSSHADIVCGGSGGTGSACSDFVTGGGWITGTPSGAKGNFGVAGGIKDGAFWGHLNYIDHGNGMHVVDTAVTGYAVDANDANCRYINYNVMIDGSPGTAQVHVCDNGEPGRNDIFEITLSNGYHAGGDLGGSQPGGGNIQLHRCQ